MTAVTLMNPFHDKMVIDEKLSILDIKARDASGRQFNVEMQMVAPPEYPQRVLYYWAKLYTEQLKEGQDFVELRPTISISFLNNQRFRDAGFHHVFRLRDQSGPLVLTEDLEIHLIELPKFTLAAEQLTTPLDVWCYFLRHGAELDTESLPNTLNIPPVRRAMEVLHIMTQNDLEREIYEGRIKALRDRASELRGARQEGRLIERILTCQELLKLPLTPEVELENLSFEELAALAESLKKQIVSAIE